MQAVLKVQGFVRCQVRLNLSSTCASEHVIGRSVAAVAKDRLLAVDDLNQISPTKAGPGSSPSEEEWLLLTL